MKKLVYITLMLILLLPVRISAASFNTSMGSSKTINPGGQFTITFSASNTTNIMGIVGRLTYDSSKLTVIGSTGLNGFNLTLGSNLVVDNSTGKSGTFSFASVTFKATSSFVAGDSSTVSLSNVVGSDGTNDLTGGSSSVIVNVVAPKSSNNNLSSLAVNGSSVPSFSASKTGYTLTVNNNVTTAVIQTVAADSKSSVTGAGTKSLNIYSNTFNIVVTAENGSKKTYTVTILRKDGTGRTAPLSTNNNLKSLTVEGYNLEFVATTFNYNLTVENNISSLVIKAEANDSKATVVIDKSDDLKIGDNSIKVTVTAENGDKKIYTLMVKRKNEGPTTTIGELLNIISDTASSVINVDISDNNTTLTENILNSIKNNNKSILINQYDNNKNLLYKWEINGSNITDKTSINTFISFETENKDLIGSLTNYADNLYLNFSHVGALPESTYISINVASKYKDGSKVNLYAFNKEEQKITKVYDDLVVSNGYIRFELNHCSEYVLSMSDYNQKGNVLIYQIVIGILGIIVLYFAGKSIYNKSGI